MPTYQTIRGSEPVPGLTLSVAYMKLLEDAQWLETSSSCCAFERALGYVGDDVQVILCLGCFCFKINYDDTSFGPTVDQKQCAGCGHKKPETLFVSQQGYLTKFCDTCRSAWAREKHKAEKEEKKAVFKQEMAEAAVTTTERLKKLAEALEEPDQGWLVTE